MAGPVSGARLIDDRVLAAMEEFTLLRAGAQSALHRRHARPSERRCPGCRWWRCSRPRSSIGWPKRPPPTAVPYEWKEELGVRRYGFHGASHRAASERAQEVLGRRDLRHISCHLGGSSSLAAIRNGVAVETSFGMSPQSGLPQNNRTGDLDVFAALFVMKKRGPATWMRWPTILVNRVGARGHQRHQRRHARPGSRLPRRAAPARGWRSTCSCAPIRHYLGACLVELGGLDVLTFSGGIGENSAEIRAGVCARPRGVRPRARRRARIATARGEARHVRAMASRVRVLIVPADEERIVARRHRRSAFRQRQQWRSHGR